MKKRVQRALRRRRDAKHKPTPATPSRPPVPQQSPWEPAPAAQIAHTQLQTAAEDAARTWSREPDPEDELYDSLEYSDYLNNYLSERAMTGSRPEREEHPELERLYQIHYHSKQPQPPQPQPPPSLQPHHANGEEGGSPPDGDDEFEVPQPADEEPITGGGSGEARRSRSPAPGRRSRSSSGGSSCSSCGSSSCL